MCHTGDAHSEPGLPLTPPYTPKGDNGKGGYVLPKKKEVGGEGPKS